MFGGLEHWLRCGRTIRPAADCGGAARGGHSKVNITSCVRGWPRTPNVAVAANATVKGDDGRGIR